jgi:hypothetical protein
VNAEIHLTCNWTTSSLLEPNHHLSDVPACEMCQSVFCTCPKEVQENVEKDDTDVTEAMELREATGTQSSVQLASDMFVISIYDEDFYVAKVLSVDDQQATLKFMQTRGRDESRSFVWHNKDDVLVVPLEDVVSVIDEPVAKSRYFKLTD